MRTFTAPLCELGEFEEITKLLKKPGAAAALTGCVDSQKLHMVYGLSDGFKYKIIVTFSDLRAKEIYEDYKLYDKNGKRADQSIAEDYGRASPDSGDYF